MMPKEMNLTDKFRFFNLPLERGEILFSSGFLYVYGYLQNERKTLKRLLPQSEIQLSETEKFFKITIDNSPKSYYNA